MDPRTKKSRSLGIDPNLSKQPTSTSTSNRPDLGDRHNSAPSVARRRQSDSKRSSEGTKAPDRTRRSVQAASRDHCDDHSSLALAGDSQITERHRASASSAKCSIKSVDREQLPLLTYAVVGNSSVGKSAFICNALDLRRPVTSIPSSKVSLGGLSYRLQLIETPQESVSFVHEEIVWSPVHDTESKPVIDGVLCLYDVSNRDSIEGLSRLLAVLDANGLATCLVSCKVDIPLCDQEIPSDFPARVKAKYPDIVVEETRIDSSDSAKRCLLRLLKQTIPPSAKEAHELMRSRADSHAAANFPPRTSSRNPSTSSSRSRSRPRHQAVHNRSRENLLTIPPPTVIESEDEEEASEATTTDEEVCQPEAPARTALRVNTDSASHEPRPGHPQTPISTTEASSSRLFLPSSRAMPAAPATPESFLGTVTGRRSSADTTDSRIYRTFLNMDDESTHEDMDSSEEAADGLRDLTVSGDSSSEGVTFGDLVDRLLAMPTTRGDQKFVPAFLCLYRAFATPLRLLMSIIERFVKTEASDLVAFTKAAELLRYLSILGLWTTYYPGDFADVKIREMASAFVTTVEKTKSYAAAARQIANNLQTFVPDGDDDWAVGDASTSSRSRSNTTSQKSTGSGASREPRLYQRQLRKSKENNDSESDDEDVPATRSQRHSGTTSSASSLVKVSQISSQTSDNLQNLESAREQAKRLRMIPHNPVSKIQWHQFMSCTTEELATEITRIDWTMYSAIRPRDFVRYVTVANKQREKHGHIDYIGMMTRHFNHLALFVSGMILLRDKPKHRVQMLEKFMDLAWKVRQMNNYHALGAIVAALNSEEILRLAQTQELIPQEQHKQFLRLKILMGHQKSHAAYRMAWDNSSSERIPFLPRIQEDLTKAAQANPTYFGSRINWSKFEVMGETIISVQRSQDQPYNFPDRTARGQDISRLILETRVLEGDEDCADPKEELYERSKQVEPPATGGVERKKFDWLRR